MKSKTKIDGSLKSKIYNFLEKLQEDDTAPGLHIEPMHNPKDQRVRTGRVDLNYRAVLYRLDPAGEPHYIYIGAWPHDEAIEIARSSVLQINPVNGVLELIKDSEPDRSDAQPGDITAVKPPVVSSDPEPGFVNGLATAGYTPEYLMENLGIDPEVARRAVAARSLEQFSAVVDNAPEWQGIALIDLEAGKSLADVKEELGLGQYVDDETKSEDEKIREALDHPASKIEFAFIGENPQELKNIIEFGDFEAWRTFLHPEQRQYAEKSRTGSFRLSGGAGTGKTVVALHRAKALADAEPPARIVLTTFTTTLAESLATNVATLDPSLAIATKLGQKGICVAGIDSLAHQIWTAASADERSAALNAVLGVGDQQTTKRTDKDAWDFAAESVDHGLEPTLANPTFLDQEYLSVVLANSVTTKDEYLKVPRAGRGTALNRPKRIAVWRIIEAYRRANRMEDKASYAEIAALAAAALNHRASNGGPRPAEHVIVDEAQDFHAGHWLLLRALVAEGPNDLFIAEDSHQRLYGQKVSLSRFGIHIVGRSRRLTLNYRTTAQNLAFAVKLLSGAEFHDIEDGAEKSSDYRSARSGPEPVRQGLESLNSELDLAADHIRRWQEKGNDGASIGILVRAKHQQAQVVNSLNERGIHVRSIEAPTDDRNEPVVMTMHRAKGMEFAKVILFGVSDSSLPQKHAIQGLAEAERDDALLRERSLLYVAATRARDELVVTWNGKPSELLGTE
ncbi:3'-5' exonuclease [Arthrobacter sp. 2RAF22]|uniref:3'-5' exonuclease n=1 Tax=Arthrobacter sp. 2RAF22 TaxID=3232996 RepID=UPI003F8DDE28